MSGDSKYGRFVLPDRLGEVLAEGLEDIHCCAPGESSREFSRESSEDDSDLDQEVSQRLANYDLAELVDDPYGCLLDIRAMVVVEQATRSRYTGAGEVALLVIKESRDGEKRPPSGDGDIAEALFTLRPRQRKFSH